jgi:hypothetical protein
MLPTQLSALGDAELASINKVVSASLSPQVFAADDQSGRTKHAFSEYHDASKKAVKGFVSIPTYLSLCVILLVRSLVRHYRQDRCDLEHYSCTGVQELKIWIYYLYGKMSTYVCGPAMDSWVY